jgi:hypothetical protein
VQETPEWSNGDFILDKTARRYLIPGTKEADFSKLGWVIGTTGRKIIDIKEKAGSST